MKSLSDNSDDAPRKIIAKCSNELLSNELVAQTTNLQIAEPKTLDEIVLPEQLLKTFNGDEFLLYDSGKDDEERFFIFGTEKNLKLIENGHIYVDGTFEIAPDLFYQIYSVHVLIDSKCYPVLYIPLPKKTQKLYERFLSVIESKIDCHPISINCDFERAMINASQKIFPKIKVHGCFYHFNQSLWRKIQANNLEEAYNNLDSTSLTDYRKLIKLPVVLSYIPPEDVHDIFETYKKKLDSNDPIQVKIGSFYEYFENTYLGRLTEHKTGRGARSKVVIIREMAMFDVDIWSINAR
ncbi:unnamed protein product [Brachionus calyciflorus]|uniref:MULE transposase domain-containing protein n=1 Tax=Brachionus calyciflorus TaxID=104777 RepID=A0A814FE20_9BILA|nr:unnamed protein product [Brachionus calyciflorus]